MARWLRLGVAGLAVLALLGVLAVSWLLLGRDTAAAIATVAAVPLALAVAILPPLWTRSRRRTTTIRKPTLVVSAATKPGLMRYESHREHGRTLIVPCDPYLDIVRHGGELLPQEYWHTPWGGRFTWPELDLKLANNTDQTIFFTEAVLRIATSVMDKRPVPLFDQGAVTMYLPLVNVGWGPMIDCLVRFTLTPTEPTTPTDPVFEHWLGDVGEGRSNLSLRDFFGKAGVDLDLLDRLDWSASHGEWYFLAADSRLGEDVPANAGLGWHVGERRIRHAEHRLLRRQALGAFKDGLAVLRGTLEYSQLEADGTQTRCSNPFRCTVSFEPSPPGAPVPPTSTYEVLLRVDDRGYEVAVPLSHAIAPGDVDRFLLQVAADSSSIHEFTLALVYNGELTVTSEPIVLELFLSRLDAPFVAAGAKEEPYPAAAPAPSRPAEVERQPLLTAATLEGIGSGQITVILIGTCRRLVLDVSSATIVRGTAFENCTPATIHDLQVGDAVYLAMSWGSASTADAQPRTPLTVTQLYAINPHRA